MHWLLLVANTLTAEPTLIAKFESEADCVKARTDLSATVVELLNRNIDLNEDAPLIACKAPLKATELP